MTDISGGVKSLHQTWMWCSIQKQRHTRPKSSACNTF